MGSGVASVAPAGGTSLLKNGPVLCSRIKAPQTTGPENPTLAVSTGPWEIAVALVAVVEGGLRGHLGDRLGNDQAGSDDEHLAVESSGLNAETYIKMQVPETRTNTHTHAHAMPTQLTGESRIRNEPQ